MKRAHNDFVHTIKVWIVFLYVGISYSIYRNDFSNHQMFWFLNVCSVHPKLIFLFLLQILYLFYNESCHFVLYVHNASLPCGQRSKLHAGSRWAYNLHCFDPDFYGGSFCVGSPRYNWGVIHWNGGVCWGSIVTLNAEKAFWSSWSKSLMVGSPCHWCFAPLRAEVKGASAALWHPGGDPVIQRSSVLIQSFTATKRPAAHVLRLQTFPLILTPKEEPQYTDEWKKTNRLVSWFNLWFWGE